MASPNDRAASAADSRPNHAAAPHHREALEQILRLRLENQPDKTPGQRAIRCFAFAQKIAKEALYERADA